MKYEAFHQLMRAAGQYPGKPHKLLKKGANSFVPQPLTQYERKRSIGLELISVYARKGQPAVTL